MQFTAAAAAAFMATAVMAHGSESVVYTTKEVTITSCGPTVTNCPAHSTVVSTTSYPVITSSVVFSNTSTPVVPAPPATTFTPSYATSKTSAVVIPPPASSVPAVSSPAGSLSTITISTCVPTVIYSTVTVAPTVPVAPVPAPSSTGYIQPPKNVTSPSATATPTQFTGSAAGVQASFGFAAVAGLAAFILA